MFFFFCPGGRYRYALDLKALLARGDDTEPVAELVALQIALCEVLEVALAEGDRGRDPDLALALALHLDDVAQLAGLVVNLDAVVQELFKRGGVEDAIAGRAAKVNEELVAALLVGSACLRRLVENSHRKE